MLNSDVTWFPPHLRGAKCFEAPEPARYFAEGYGVQNVVFVDDEVKCKRSVRQECNIFINTRCTYWGAMILPPWLCKSPPEAILQRLLHEVAHVALKHPPDKGVVSSIAGLTIQQSSSPWDALRGQEAECWKWVLGLRKANSGKYELLKSAIEGWYSAHTHEHKDWSDLPEAQWAKFNKGTLPPDLWLSVPQWVRDEFRKQL